MFRARVEQKARTRFDDASEAQLPKPPRDAFGLHLEICRIGIEVVVIEGQRNAVVPVFGDQLERIAEPVVRDAVGVISKTQIHAPARQHAANFFTGEPRCG